jgi:hypothetical protein
VPIEQLPLLTKWTQLDYDWVDNDRQWKIPKDKGIGFELVSEDWLTTLKVTQALEK